MAYPPRLFCDTSFFYASLDPADANHERARAAAGEAIVSRSRLYSTWDIVSETVTLLRYRMGRKATVLFLDEVAPKLILVPYGDGVRKEAERVFRQQSSRHRLSFCDAISFVVVTALLDHVACLSFDGDFKKLGLSVLP